MKALIDIFIPLRGLPLAILVIASMFLSSFIVNSLEYKDLKKLNKGSGLEVHHIVEKRFARSISPNLKQSEMLSVALDPVEHRAFTNAWRTNLPYGKADYGVNEIWVAAQKIYANYPSLLEAARKTIWGN